MLVPRAAAEMKVAMFARSAGEVASEMFGALEVTWSIIGARGEDATNALWPGEEPFGEFAHLQWYVVGGLFAFCDYPVR